MGRQFERLVEMELVENSNFDYVLGLNKLACPLVADKLVVARIPWVNCIVEGKSQTFFAVPS